MEEQNQNNSSRRDFLKKSYLAGVGITTTFLSSCSEPKAEKEKKEPGNLSEINKKLMSKFDLKYPIFQAAPGGEALAVAVANAGGMGAVSLGWYEPNDAYEVVLRLKKATKGNFYANYILHLGTDSLDRVLEAGCPTIQFSWGIPSAEMVKPSSIPRPRIWAETRFFLRNYR